MSRVEELLYVTCGGTLVALVKSNGKEIWRSDIGSSGFATVEVDPPSKMLFVSSNGKIYAFNSTGKMLWKNNLPGHGYRTATLVIPDTSAPSTVRTDYYSAPSIAPPTYDSLVTPTPPQPNYAPPQPLYPALSTEKAKGQNDVIYCASNSLLCCIRKSDGVDLWRTPVNGTGTALIVEDGMVYAAGNGKVEALNAATGQILWQNDLKGLWYGDVQIATLKHSSASQGILNASMEAQKQ